MSEDQPAAGVPSNPHESDPPEGAHDDRDGRDGVTFLRQFAGFLVGVVLGLVLVFSALFAAIQTPWPMVAALVLCLISGVVILVRKNLRAMGAGLLAGFAVGLITFAGACGGLLGVLVIGNR